MEQLIAVLVVGTIVAALFEVARTTGYTLSRHARFVTGTAWSDSVIRWEVGIGLALIPLAGHLWRRGGRPIDRHQPTHA